MFIIIAIAAATPASANLLTNGSFEFAASGCENPSIVNQCIDSWEVVVEDAHLVGPGIWEAADGLLSIDLDGQIGSSGAVRQTFATLPGTPYLVTFFMAGNPDFLPIVKPMRVSADGQSAEFTFDIKGKSRPSNMGWVQINWTFVANDLSASLMFQSLTQEKGLQAGWGPAVDNVSVIAVPGPEVPEPSTWMLLGMGMTGLAYQRKRASKATALCLPDARDSQRVASALMWRLEFGWEIGKPLFSLSPSPES